MKRIASSDSLGALMSMCPTAEEHSPRGNHMYSREYQSMLDGLDEEGCVEEGGHVAEKKRRLSVDQVKALERNFEVENKLEPERKVKLAQELGLQPRQVAVWFQNRRARWKTKQLERDYGVLKSNFDALKQNFESLQHDKDALLKEIKELKSKLNEDDSTECNLSIKEEALVDNNNDDDNNIDDDKAITPPASLTVGSDDANMKGKTGSAPLVFAEFKDGPSDSDSSAILNDDHSPNASNSSSGVLQNNHQMMMSPHTSSFRFNCSSSSSPSSINCFNFSDTRSDGLGNAQNSNSVYHPQFVKMEEHNFFGGEEACNFFSDEQAPTLHWYCADQWT